MTELELLRAEVADLRTFVLQLHERTRNFVMRYREAASDQLSHSEDWLDTPYDRSLLAKRREKVRR
jgi:hypothetical protein